MPWDEINIHSLDWDDTELIAAYDRNKRKRLRAERAKKKGSSNKENNEKWNVADYCRAVYPEDNLLYEAEIVSMDDGICTIMFVGYEDVLEVNVEDLKETKGALARNSQRADAKRFYGTSKWKVGDFCCAVYPEDNLLYEAEIVSIEDGICTIVFLGYEDVLEVNVEDLMETKGKKARKSQRLNAKQFNTARKIKSESDMRVKSNVGNQRRLSASQSQDANFMHNNSVGCSNPTSYPALPHFPASNAMFPVPILPPVPDAPFMQDSSISSMLSAWYLAGYYTGLYEAKNHQQLHPVNAKCCCHH